MSGSASKQPPISRPTGNGTYSNGNGKLVSVANYQSCHSVPQNGLPMANSGLTSTSNGLPMTYNGLTSTSSGLPMAYNGLSSTSNGLPMAYNGLTSTSNGLPMAYSGLTLSYNGLTTASNSLATGLAQSIATLASGNGIVTR
jgi:hypothetical protein